MSLSVGIHDNLILSKVAKNERGSLVVTFKQAGAPTGISALNSSSVSGGNAQREQDFLFYPPRIENFNNEIDTPENIMAKIREIVDPLTSILQQYTTGDKIKWSITDNTGIDDSNLTQKITSASVVDKIYANIVDQFIAMSKPFVGSPERMRLLLIRQSKAKHFPALRRRYLENNPFIERMSVPVSRLKYTKFEIDNGYDNPHPVGQPQSSNSSDVELAQDLFKM